MKLALIAGLLLAVLVVSGCTQTGEGVNQISVESLIATGNISIEGIYSAEFNQALPSPAGCKSMRLFQWGPGNSRMAFFSVIECYNETAASDIIAAVNVISETPATTSTISGVETNVVTDTWGIYHTWAEGNFGIIAGGLTDDYARAIAEALIGSYK